MYNITITLVEKIVTISNRVTSQLLDGINYWTASIIGRFRWAEPERPQDFVG